MLSELSLWFTAVFSYYSLPQRYFCHYCLSYKLLSPRFLIHSYFAHYSLPLCNLQTTRRTAFKWPWRRRGPREYHECQGWGRRPLRMYSHQRRGHCLAWGTAARLRWDWPKRHCTLTVRLTNAPLHVYGETGQINVARVWWEWPNQRCTCMVRLTKSTLHVYGENGQCTAACVWWDWPKRRCTCIVRLIFMVIIRWI